MATDYNDFKGQEKDSYRTKILSYIGVLSFEVRTDGPS